MKRIWYGIGSTSFLPPFSFGFVGKDFRWLRERERARGGRKLSISATNDRWREDRSRGNVVTLTPIDQEELSRSSSLLLNSISPHLSSNEPDRSRTPLGRLILKTRDQHRAGYSRRIVPVGPRNESIRKDLPRVCERAINLSDKFQRSLRSAFNAG